MNKFEIKRRPTHPSEILGEDFKILRKHDFFIG
jgi:hypothetical protein